jgi:hypothetical protein
MATSFENTVLEGNLQMRNETPKALRPLQMIYRREQVRQLTEDLLSHGVNPDEIEYYGYDFQKNLCPSTGMESEGGVLYNKRTGVSVPIVLEWVCQYTCGLQEWRGEYEPTLDKCQPVYFFNNYAQGDLEKLR